MKGPLKSNVRQVWKNLALYFPTAKSPLPRSLNAVPESTSRPILRGTRRKRRLFSSALNICLRHHLRITEIEFTVKVFKGGCCTT